MRSPQRFVRGVTWTTGLYAADRLGTHLRGRPIRTFGVRPGLCWPRSAHTQADPFVTVHGGRLYLFHEVVRGRRPGVIEAWSSADLTEWQEHGVVLQRPHHLSYPTVIRSGGALFLMVESKAAEVVELYRFDRFPDVIRQQRIVLRGAYNDPTPFFHEGRWYVFATSSRGLELHHADGPLLDGPFERHPVGIVEPAGPRARCGGPPLTIDGRLYRPAQDGRRRYGGGLELREIVDLSPTGYVEREAAADVVPAERWSTLGGHHLSTTRFNGGFVYAVDGQRPASLLERLSARAGMLLDLAGL